MKTALPFPFLLLALGVGQALADTPIQLQHAASASVHVSISNVKGRVTVNAWDKPEVAVSGQLGEGSKPLAITGSNDDLSIKVQPQGSSGWLNWNSDNSMGSTTLELHVPRGASLDVNVVSAPLTVDGLRGGDIKINSVSSRVRLDVQTRSLDIDSVSGGIQLAGHAERARLQTVSGDILAPRLGSDVVLQTISGHIQASGGPWQKLKLSTVSGDVQLNGPLAKDGHLGIDSMSGDVDLQLPGDTSASIHASSFSGDLHSDFGTPTSPEHGPGSSLDTQIGHGDGHINVETFSGDLRIRKLD